MGYLLSATVICQMKCPFTFLSALFCSSRYCPMILDYSLSPPRYSSGSPLIRVVNKRVNKHLSKSPGKHRAVTKELVCKVKLTFPSVTKTDSVRWGNIEQLCRIEHSYLPISNFLLQLQTFWVRKTEFFKVNSWFSKRTID